MVAMFVSVGWAMIYKLRQFYSAWQATQDTGHASLFFVGLAILRLTAWLIIEALAAFGESSARKRAQLVQPSQASD